MSVAAQPIDNLGSLLEDRLKHVGHSTRETTEVGENDQGKTFTVGILDDRGSLARTVGEPDGTGEGDTALGRVFVGRIGRVDSLNRSSLGGDDGNRDTANTSSATDDCLRPTT